MKKILLILVCLLPAIGYGSLENRVYKYLYDSGIYAWPADSFVVAPNPITGIRELRAWKLDIPRPKEADLMSEEQLLSVDLNAMRNQYLQNSKPANLKRAENEYIEYCDKIFGSKNKRTLLEFTDLTDGTSAIKAQVLLLKIGALVAAWSDSWYKSVDSWDYIILHE